MIPIAAYMRCSGASQISGDTWERQLESIQACCLSKGFTIVHEYREEGISGKLGEDSRPAFQEMVFQAVQRHIGIKMLGNIDAHAL